MSSVNSLVSSSFKDKENTNPNYQSKNVSCFNSSDKGKQGPFHSLASRPSFFNSINHHESTHQSLKTIFRHFCSSTQEHSRVQNQSFKDMLKIYTGKSDLTLPEAIKVCETLKVYNKSDLLQILNGQNSSQNKNLLPFRKLLCTELGGLKIQLLCENLREEHNVDSEQEKILQELFRQDYEGEINVQSIMEAYQQLKEDQQLEENELRRLKGRYTEIYGKKIQPKLWCDHIRLQLSKGFNMRSYKDRITYEGMEKTLKQLVTSDEVGVIFRYLYATESGVIMSLLDRTKTLSKNLVISHIFVGRGLMAETMQNASKNVEYSLEEQHKEIERLKKDQNQLIEVLASRDKEIERMNKMFELMEIEKQETERIRKRDYEIKIQRERNQYEKRIQGLLKTNREQKKLTEWYQNELEGVLKATNTGNVILHAMAEQF